MAYDFSRDSSTNLANKNAVRQGRMLSVVTFSAVQLKLAVLFNQLAGIYWKLASSSSTKVLSPGGRTRFAKSICGLQLAL